MCVCVCVCVCVPGGGDEGGEGAMHLRRGTTLCTLARGGRCCCVFVFESAAAARPRPPSPPATASRQRPRRACALTWRMAVYSSCSTAANWPWSTPSLAGKRRWGEVGGEGRLSHCRGLSQRMHSPGVKALQLDLELKLGCASSCPRARWLTNCACGGAAPVVDNGRGLLAWGEGVGIETLRKPQAVLPSCQRRPKHPQRNMPLRPPRAR